MAGYKIPTAQETADQSLEAIESSLNIETPAVDVAFNRVIAGMIALAAIPQYKYAANLSIQNFAISATGDGLDLIGNNYNTPRKVAESTVMTISLPATNGTVIAQGHDFTGDQNGLRYHSDAEVTASGGVAVISVTCEISGPDGNLVAGQDTLTIGTPIPGAESVASITSVDNTGVDEEEDEDYRPRVLFVLRSVCGGWSATDYRVIGEKVGGVKRIYPYTGKPYDSGETDYPGDRTIYVEATTDVDADGIAPQYLLDEVRAALLTDPLSGIAINNLGDTDENLTVKSITRTSVFIDVRGLTIDATLSADYKSDVTSAFNLYFEKIAPFVPGIDFEIDKNDTISETSCSGVVDDINRAYGAYTSEVVFGFTPDTTAGATKLNPGERLKIGAITYDGV